MAEQPAHRILLAAVLAVVLSAQLPDSAAAQERPCVAVDRDVVIAAQKVNRCPLLVVNAGVTLQPDSTQRGSVNVAGGDLVVQEGAMIDGHVAVMDGDVEVYGSVTERLFTTGDVTLGPKAEVNGDVRALGEVVRAEGAKVHGKVQAGLRPLPGGDADVSEAWAKLVGGVSFAFLAVVFAALALVIAPDAMGRVHNALVRSVPACVVAGLVAVVLFPLLSILLVPTVVGPMILAAVYLVGLAVGSVGLGQSIGSRLWPSGARAGQAALGTGLLAALLALGLASNSKLLCGVLVVVGLVSVWVLGGSLLTLFGLRRWPRGSAPAMPTEQSVGPSTGFEAAEDTGEVPAPEAVARPVLPPAPSAEARVDSQAPSVMGEVGAEDQDEDSEPGSDTRIESDTVGTREGAGGTEPTGAVGSGQKQAGEGQGDEPTPGWGWSDTAPPAAQSTDAAGPLGLDQKSAAGGEGRDTGSLHDLLRVPGVTPIYGHLLREAGIRTLSDLADADPATIAEAISVPGVLPVGRDAAEDWIRYAQELQRD